MRTDLPSSRICLRGRRGTYRGSFMNRPSRAPTTAGRVPCSLSVGGGVGGALVRVYAVGICRRMRQMEASRIAIDLGRTWTWPRLFGAIGARFGRIGSAACVGMRWRAPRRAIVMEAAGTNSKAREVVKARDGTG